MPAHVFIDDNKLGRDFVVGDIHGMYDLLMKQLDGLHFDRSKDRLFSVGDLIDRGPDSAKCLGLLDCPWFFAVRGNHEDMMVEALASLNGRDMELWLNNGGQWILDYQDFQKNKEVLSMANKVAGLPVAITISKPSGLVGICHAQPPGEEWAMAQNPSERQETIMLWGRVHVYNEDALPTSGVHKTYHGHTPIQNPVVRGNAHYIDTGSCFSDGYLTIQEIL